METHGIKQHLMHAIKYFLSFLNKCVPSNTKYTLARKGPACDSKFLVGKHTKGLPQEDTISSMGHQKHLEHQI